MTTISGKTCETYGSSKSYWAIAFVKNMIDKNLALNWRELISIHSLILYFTKRLINIETTCKKENGFTHQIHKKFKKEIEELLTAMKLTKVLSPHYFSNGKCSNAYWLFTLHKWKRKKLRLWILSSLQNGYLITNTAKV
jgi:hypothetical protein